MYILYFEIINIQMCESLGLSLCLVPLLVYSGSRRWLSVKGSGVAAGRSGLRGHLQVGAPLPQCSTVLATLVNRSTLHQNQLNCQQTVLASVDAGKGHRKSPFLFPLRWV